MWALIVLFLAQQQFLERQEGNLFSWFPFLLICLIWTSAPPPCFVLFYESLISRVYCSLPLQMPVYYYPSGQYPTSTTQQYRPIASVQYNAQRSQQIPQTAQQAGMYIWYSFLQLLTVPLQVKPVGCAPIEQQRRKLVAVLFENTVKIRNWEIFSWTSWAMEEQGLHPPSLLSCCCVLSVHTPSGWAQSWDWAGVSSHTAPSSHPLRLPSTMGTPQVFVPPFVVGRPAVRQKGPVVLHTLCCACARSSRAVRGWCRGERLPAAVRLEGGPLHCKRVSSRSHSEPVSFPAVSRHPGSLQSKRDRGGAGLVCVGREQELWLSRSHRISRE